MTSVKVNVSRLWVTVTIMETERWQDQASCKGMDTELFYPENCYRPRHVRHVRDVCASCPVQRECRNFAIGNGEVYGIWGGTTRIDRINLGMEPPGDPRWGRDWVLDLRGCGTLAGLQWHEVNGVPLCRKCLGFASRRDALLAMEGRTDVA